MPTAAPSPRTPLMIGAVLALLLLVGAGSWPLLKRSIHPARVAGLVIQGPPGAQVWVAGQGRGRVPYLIDEEELQTSLAPLGSLSWAGSQPTDIKIGKWELSSQPVWQHPDSTHVFVVRIPTLPAKRLLEVRVWEPSQNRECYFKGAQVDFAPGEQRIAIQFE
ncbi:MAG: hypothetical protein AB7N76_31065 [Planctomycetota bacterium]